MTNFVHKMSDRKCVAAAIIVCSLIKKKQEIKTKRLWVRNWIAKRDNEGVHAKLLKEVSVEDSISYENFMRMSKNDYQNLWDVTAVFQMVVYLQTVHCQKLSKIIL